MHYQQNGHEPHYQYNPQQQNTSIYVMPAHRRRVMHWSWHAVLTILTGGMWGLVWVWLIATGRR